MTSSIFRIVPATQALSRRIMNSKPSFEIRVMNGVEAVVVMFDGWFEIGWMWVVVMVYD